jgi:hypothetical protein
MNFPEDEIRERTTLLIAVVGLSLVLIGCALLYLSSLDRHIVSLPWRTLLANVGSLFLVTGTVTVAWELAGKRAFADEIRAVFAVSKSFAIAGVRKYATAFQSSEIDWDALFYRTRFVDLLFMGNSSWRRSQFLHLEALLQRDGSRLMIILPDPMNEVVIASAKARLGGADADPKKYFQKTCEYFRNLSNKFPSAHIEIWFIPQLPSFSVFRFDDSAVVALYSHRRAQVGVPTFICDKGGDLFKYATSEIDSVVGRNGKTPSGHLHYTSKHET